MKLKEQTSLFVE